MLGQATSILTSSVGAGIVTAHNKMLQDERMKQGLSNAGLPQISNDAYTASVTMILNGVNSFLYQIVLLPLYILIAAQKTMVCTTNDVFGLFDITGFTIRVGKPDLQAASDVSSGVCLSAFFESQINAIGETDSSNMLAQGANDLLKNAGQSASSFVVSGGTSSIQGSQSARILTLLSGSKLSQQAGNSHFDKIPASVRNAATQAGSKTATLFEQFKSTKLVGKLGAAMSSLQLKAPVHLIDSMITYAIGVVSGLQDMAQVCCFFCRLFQIHKPHAHTNTRRSCAA